jgi:YgiT-type zinc finger domain-containing protein
MKDRVTDLPFKTGEATIVIIKRMPVIECPTCNEFVLADSVMLQVERILESVGKNAELEVVRYAA